MAPMRFNKKRSVNKTPKSQTAAEPEATVTIPLSLLTDNKHPRIIQIGDGQLLLLSAQPVNLASQQNSTYAVNSGELVFDDDFKEEETNDDYHAAVLHDDYDDEDDQLDDSPNTNAASNRQFSSTRTKPSTSKNDEDDDDVDEDEMITSSGPSAARVRACRSVKAVEVAPINCLVQTAELPTQEVAQPAVVSGYLEPNDEVAGFDEEPLYVNAKQFERILARRRARAKLEARGIFVKMRPKYLHESRHKHAINRTRGPGGKFHNEKVEATIP